mmetsp:Transcript_48498/g.128505  ORF Transcript_48498/g.128505 Transcript_48498/m.128505 type:complete len:226 (+) Transcript_48498:600-1277(+)
MTRWCTWRQLFTGLPYVSLPAWRGKSFEQGLRRSNLVREPLLHERRQLLQHLCNTLPFEKRELRQHNGVILPAQSLADPCRVGLFCAALQRFSVSTGPAVALNVCTVQAHLTTQHYRPLRLARVKDRRDTSGLTRLLTLLDQITKCTDRTLQQNESDGIYNGRFPTTVVASYAHSSILKLQALSTKRLEIFQLQLDQTGSCRRCPWWKPRVVCVNICCICATPFQ